MLLMLYLYKALCMVMLRLRMTMKWVSELMFYLSVFVLIAKYVWVVCSMYVCVLHMPIAAPIVPGQYLPGLQAINDFIYQGCKSLMILLPLNSIVKLEIHIMGDITISVVLHDDLTYMATLPINHEQFKVMLKNNIRGVILTQ